MLFNFCLCLNTSDKKKSAFLSDLNFLLTIKLYNVSSLPISVCSLNCFLIIARAFDFFSLSIISTVTCLTKNSNISPDVDDTSDLGSTTQKWKDLYVDGVAYLDAVNLNGNPITATADQINYNSITTLGTAEASKTVTSDVAGNVTFVDGACNIDIASHDGTNGLELGGVLVTKTATQINQMSTLEDATAVAVSMAIALG